MPQICLNSLLAQANGCELVPNVHEQGATLWQVADEALEGLVVLQEIISVDQGSVVLGLGIVLRSIAPLASVGVVIANGAPGLLQEVLVPSDQCHDTAILPRQTAGSRPPLQPFA